jgi:hypothetical protein
LSQDLLTQDNGAFIEVIRSGARETDPVISIAHLDAQQCRRTGNPEQPVKYFDPRTGEIHELSYWQVITLEEMPSAVATMNGVGYCAVTRILRAAQIMRDLQVLDAEKVGGRFTKRVHLVGGVSQTIMEDSIRRNQEQADNRGYARFIEPIILASLDPTATVNHVEIDLASVPDGLDRAQAFSQYIASLALAFGEDYQMFAPLPSGNLGTSTQSAVLDRKAQGTGVGLFNKMLLHILNMNGVIPQSVEATIEERDYKAESEKAAVEAQRASTRAARIGSQEITPQVARQIAADDGDLAPEYLELMNEANVTEDITVTDDERVQTEQDLADSVSTAAKIESQIQQRRQAQTPPQAPAPVAPEAQPIVKDLKKKFKDIGEIAGFFGADLEGLTRKAWRGRIGARAFAGQMDALLEQYLKAAYLEGMDEHGFDESELDAQDRAVIRTELNNQRKYVDGFADAVMDAKSENDLRPEINKRVVYWARSIEGVGMLAKSNFANNQVVTWKLGGAEEHCQTCRDLDGQRHRRTWFTNRGYLPRTPGAKMDCKGFNCECILVEGKNVSSGG